ncbi:MAG: AAA family ATPase [Armatimonadota bacterium]
MGKARNPFHWRGTVTEADAFIGRERELASIFARLQSLGCVSVVGERRIGKSSLAYQAYERCPKMLGPDCAAAFVDLLSSRHHTLDGLLGSIADGLGVALAAPSGGAPEKLAAFEGRIRALRGSGKLPVVFLDEFEGLASRVEQFGDGLLESWRSLGNDGQMAFVCTSARPMEEVTKQSELTSSFYNIFGQVKLTEFTEAEARQFARHAMKLGGFELTEEAFLLRVGKQHPLRLQVAAWHLFEARQSGSVDYGRLSDQVEEEVAAMMKG